MKKVLRAFFALTVICLAIALFSARRVSAAKTYYNPETEWSYVKDYLDGSQTKFDQMARSYRMRYPEMTPHTTHDEFVAMVNALNARLSDEWEEYVIAHPSTPVATARQINALFSDGYKDNDVFGNMRQYVKSSGVSFFKLAMAIALIVVLISLMVAALKLGKKNPHEREEAKRKVIFIVIVAGIIFSIVTIIAFVEWFTNRSIELIH